MRKRRIRLQGRETKGGNKGGRRERKREREKKPQKQLSPEGSSHNTFTISLWLCLNIFPPNETILPN